MSPSPPAAASADRSVVPDLLGQLVAGAALGQVEKFAALYDRTAVSVYGLALRITRSENRSAAVTLATYCQAWRGSARYRPGSGSVLSWLLDIAHGCAVKDVRMMPAAEPAAGWAGADQVREQALGVLTRIQRDAVRMACFDGRADHDVALVLGLGVEQVRAEVREGLAHLGRAAA